MQTQIDLAESAFTKDLANFIELDPCLGHLVVSIEAVSDDFCQKSDFTRARAQAVLIVLIVLFFLLLDHQRVVEGHD